MCFRSLLSLSYSWLREVASKAGLRKRPRTGRELLCTLSSIVDDHVGYVVRQAMYMVGLSMAHRQCATSRADEGNS